MISYKHGSKILLEMFFLDLISYCSYFVGEWSYWSDAEHWWSASSGVKYQNHLFVNMLYL